MKTYRLSIPFVIPFVALLVLGLLINLGLAPAVYAATFDVTRLDDPAPNGCLVGDCSLREAVIAANAAGGADTINLLVGSYSLTRPGTAEDAADSGDLDITDDVTITGAGFSSSIIDGSDLDRVFHILPGNTVTIQYVAVRNGTVTGARGGGIANFDSNLTLQGVSIQDNVSTAQGGAIYNEATAGPATILLVSSIVQNNSATGTDGGGIYNRSEGATALITVTHSTVFSNNAANGKGGGIINVAQDVTAVAQVNIDHATINWNGAANGAGIYSLADNNTGVGGPQASVTVSASTLDNNFGRAGAAGIQRKSRP